MRKTITIVLCLVGMLVGACAKEPDYPKAPEYVNPAAPRFPVMAYHAFNNPDMFTVKNFQHLSDAGFTLTSSWHADTVPLKQMLDLCQQVGIKGFIKTTLVANQQGVKDLISNYGECPGLAGYVLVDEPGANYFPKLKGLVKETVQQSPEPVLAYVNLFPEYASDKQLQTDGYRAYIDEYITKVNPQFLTFDNYGIIETDEGVVLRDDYFSNLEIVSKAARLSGRPMWTFVLSTAHYDFPVPSKGQISFQVFSGLAYGSQGIQYYGYATPPGGEVGYHDAPVSPSGRRNKVWYHIRDVNRQVHALSDIFLGMNLIGVWHTGIKLPAGTRRLSAGNLPKGVHHIFNESAGLTVSRFSNGDHEYMLIVNHDFSHKQKVQVTADSSVVRIDERRRETQVGNKPFKLVAGGWVLLRVGDE